MPSNDIQIVYRKVDDLIPYANNPRDNAKAIDAVAKSIKRFGVRSPAIVDKNGVIIAGHTRILAAKKLGLKEFPVVVADDLTPEQANLYRLMDNRAQEESQWDTDFLSQELKDLKVNGFDLSDTGFTPFEIDSLTFDFAAAEADYARKNYNTNTGEYPTTPNDPTAAGEYASVHDAAEYDAQNGSMDKDDDELPYSTYDGAAEGPSGYARPAAGTNTSPETNAAPAPRFEAFACIICCATPQDQDFVRELIHEPEELKQRYSMHEILEKLEAQ